MRDDQLEVVTFDQTLNAFKKRKPFRPFTVAMTSGDRFEVDALVVRDGVAIYGASGGVPVIFDHEGVSNLLVI